MMGARATRWVEFIEAAVVDLCDGFNFGITAFASTHYQGTHQKLKPIINGQAEHLLSICIFSLDWSITHLLSEKL